MAGKNGNTSTNLGFEDQLWKAADALRSNMDAAEDKHVVLGLIFLKYILDSFEGLGDKANRSKDISTPAPTAPAEPTAIMELGT